MEMCQQRSATQNILVLMRAFLMLLTHHEPSPVEVVDAASCREESKKPKCVTRHGAAEAATTTAAESVEHVAWAEHLVCGRKKARHMPRDS